MVPVRLSGRHFFEKNKKFSKNTLSKCLSRGLQVRGQITEPLGTIKSEYTVTRNFPGDMRLTTVSMRDRCANTHCECDKQTDPKGRRHLPLCDDNLRGQ